jgi:hypothetical protein
MPAKPRRSIAIGGKATRRQPSAMAGVKENHMSLLQNSLLGLRGVQLTADIYCFYQPGTAQAEACGYIL